MRNLSDTIARLSALKGFHVPRGPVVDRLFDIARFGSNPGALRARAYVPDDLPEEAALVVVLHGCTQSAAGYDHGAGWSRLADEAKFALLFPEQQRGNNPNLCFNWFQDGDIRRGAGEALSIRQMVEHMVVTYRLDRRRVFVTGLSAGGAMAGVMLATYPEVFAGGALIAGIPYGSATSMPAAFDRMRGHGLPGEEELQAAVRGASDHDGPWPIISLWHGTGDRTVDPINVEATLAQWRALHHVAAEPDRTDEVDGYPHRVWHDRSGRAVIEEFSITGMGHGTPIEADGPNGYGTPAPFMLDVDISSTLHIARFFGLVSDAAGARTRKAIMRMADTPLRAAAQPLRNGAEVVAKERVAKEQTGKERPGKEQSAEKKTAESKTARESGSRSKNSGPSVSGVGKVIEDALRKAGLMR
ncbi:extracellular catalytic domain type 1 short-chain-length polyhydroxyalkanoate depolymerase [Afifella marina]|uniref:Esterase, PHB depolymerase family n=1 Tax=Afifella marina DSM 2698 TaxID=1120955 RepID=A0A1G5MW99_AFIMA|nr:PHB depolymerase family esterase [Afifella marina]SCZ29477.1 esterase, PHB depolymerase family [Afifella marina DSM 2698]